MAAKACGFTVPHLFPSLGPALMISVGYIDLGKWFAAVDGGAQFGFSLGLLVLLFNLTAILCQYLAACIGMVSGKNLAEICSEEYSKSACMLLGVQAELSMITSDLTTILGMAHGLNLLFGVDLFTCIFFATAGSVLLPLFVTLLDNHKAEAMYIGMASFVLLFYVLGVLISQPEIPLVMIEIFPKLSGENVYSLMALLGSNIMAHNFYIHSSIVQQQRRSPNVATGALSHDHFFAILFIFTGIFLVNYVLMNSAAALFGNADVAVLNFQDISLLMDQIFRIPIAPIALFLVLFLSSQITALTWNIGGQVILRYFFGMDLSVWVHHAFSKALSIIPALYCARSAGAEGIYQLLIFSQVILAMLLPSSVIPLFRVASSRFIMGTFKISWLLEILALLAFLGMLAANIIFTIEMLFGNSSWIMNMRGGSAVVPFVILFISCASLGLTLYLAITPMKSASSGPDTQTWAWNSPKDHSELFDGSRGDDDLDIIKYDEDQESAVEPALDKSKETQSEKSILEFNLDHHFHQSAHVPNLVLACNPPSYQLEESKSVVEMDLTEKVDMASADVLADQGVLQSVEMKNLEEKDMGGEEVAPTDKGNEEGETLEVEESLREALPALISDCPGSLNSIKEKGPDGGNGSGSMPRLPGLGRAARRQLAAILDEFWGNLFDFHGKLTQEASAKRLDVLLGLDSKTTGSSVKPETAVTESSKSFYPDSDRGPVFPEDSRDYNSSLQKKIQDLDLSLGVQMRSPSWPETMQSNTHMQSSYRDLLEPSERRYSSLRLPQNYGDHLYQPATVHGYQMASYLKEISEGRNPYSSSMSRNPPPTPKPAASFVPNLRDQVMYTHGQSDLSISSLQSPATSRISRLQAERSYYEPSLLDSGESVAPSPYTKKYHSSPDISSLIAASRNLYLNDGRSVGPIGPRQSSGRMAYEQSQYMNTVSRAGVPLTFDELSPPKIHRDVSSLQSSMNMNNKSLWSREPFEQLFGRMGKDQSEGDRGVTHRPIIAPKETFSYADSEAKLLQSLRFCMTKLLQLEGSDWLFKQSGGFDEELIDRVALAERYLHEVDAAGRNQIYIGELQQLSSDRKFLSVPNCGDGCIWRAALVVSFGVWCIRRILELALVESRPELWGKYTYVLNRLQGIIEPAFTKPRLPLSPCACLRTPPSKDTNSIKNPVTTAATVLETIKEVEAAISGRKGRTGTAAGDVAFPKGKENLASVLKRYKRRLLNKFPGAHEGTPSSRAASTVS